MKNFDTLTDEDLCKMAAKGHDEAMSTLCGRHYSWVLNVLIKKIFEHEKFIDYKYIKDFATEIVDDTALYLISNCKQKYADQKWSVIQNFKSFFLTSAKNRLKDHYEKVKPPTVLLDEIHGVVGTAQIEDNTDFRIRCFRNTSYFRKVKKERQANTMKKIIELPFYRELYQMIVLHCLLGTPESIIEEIFEISPYILEQILSSPPSDNF